MASDSEAALGKGLEVVALTAFRADNHLRGFAATLSFHTPTASYGQAELAHGALLHAALDCLEGNGRPEPWAIGRDPGRQRARAIHLHG